MMAAFPLVQAMNSGVMPPSRVVTFTFAPAASSIFAVSRSSLKAAQCSAVLPSPCAPSMSTLSFKRDCTALRSPRIAASERRASLAKASADASKIKVPIRMFFDLRSRLRRCYRRNVQP